MSLNLQALAQVDSTYIYTQTIKHYNFRKFIGREEKDNRHSMKKANHELLYICFSHIHSLFPEYIFKYKNVNRHLASFNLLVKLCAKSSPCAKGVCVNDNQQGQGRILTLYCWFYDGTWTFPPVCIACSLAWSRPHRSEDREKIKSWRHLRMYRCLFRSDFKNKLQGHLVPMPNGFPTHRRTPRHAL